MPAPHPALAHRLLRFTHITTTRSTPSIALSRLSSLSTLTETSRATSCTTTSSLSHRRSYGSAATVAPPSSTPEPEADEGSRITRRPRSLAAARGHGVTVEAFANGDSPIVFEVSAPELGLLKGTRFDARWLRDWDVSPASIHPDTRQKQHRSGDVRPDLALDLDGSPTPALRIIPAGDPLLPPSLGTALAIRWSTGGLLPRVSSHLPLTSILPISLLAQHSTSATFVPVPALARPAPWTAASLVADSPALFLPYDEFATSQDTLHTALTQLRTHGLLFLRGVPSRETNSDRCELRRLANRIGELRHTFYGELWDVRSLGKKSRNIAYTNLDLGLHMDLLYFENPPGLQFLHSLRSRAMGGASYFVDSFLAAERLRLKSPSTFALLCKALVPYHYLNDGHHLTFSHPVIQLAPGSSPTDESPVIAHVNYSPPFQAPIPYASTEPGLLDALSAFDREIMDDALRHELRLEEGDCVIFDNRRVLHARRPFEEVGVPEGAEGTGEPQRWLKGCYVDSDPAWDKLRVLEGERAARKG